MPNLPRPNLARIAARLAQNNARVSGFLELMEQPLDELAVAIGQDDWLEVQRLSQYVAESSDSAGYARIAEQARRVCQLVDHEETRPQALEGLVRLIGMCGQVRLADEAPSPTSARLLP